MHISFFNFLFYFTLGVTRARLEALVHYYLCMQRHAVCKFTTILNIIDQMTNLVGGGKTMLSHLHVVWGVGSSTLCWDCFDHKR